MAVEKDIKIPDIGGAANVEVIEILVKKGDSISVDTPLITLESDKASMEIPSSMAGVVQSLKIKIGDKVSEGDVILSLLQQEASPAAQEIKVETSEELAATSETEQVESNVVDTSVQKTVQEAAISISDNLENTPGQDSTLIVSAGPGVRRLAHSLGVNLTDIQGSGRKSRISKEDVEHYVKSKLNEKSTGAGFSLPNAAPIDFSLFGAIEVKPLNKIKRLTGVNVHRAWISIPHVTQFDDADITDLEAFRKLESARALSSGYKLTILAFVCKIVGKALEVFPQFNASLDTKGENLIYKQYYNIGIAVETPNGLVVPVIKHVNTLSVGDIAQEMARLSSKAREKGLMPNDMNGGCFTISSLGGIGGRAFTPIVNSPEVAILGLSRSNIQPVYQQGEFVPRLMLPLSLSYDHRVIDGAEAARFTRFISESLSDLRRILL